MAMCQGCCYECRETIDGQQRATVDYLAASVVIGHLLWRAAAYSMSGAGSVALCYMLGGRCQIVVIIVSPFPTPNCRSRSPSLPRPRCKAVVLFVLFVLFVLNRREGNCSRKGRDKQKADKGGGLAIVRSRDRRFKASRHSRSQDRNMNNECRIFSNPKLRLKQATEARCKDEEGIALGLRLELEVEN